MPEFTLNKNQEQKNSLDILALKKEFRALSFQTWPFRQEKVFDAFIDLVSKMREKLSSYDTILSDDASARLVSLVLRKLINEARGRRGNKDINAYFLASGRHGSDEITRNIEKFIQKKSRDIHKALLITEHIETGASLTRVVDSLDKLGIDFDIAALSIRHVPDYYPNKITKRLIYAEPESTVGAQFHSEQLLTGVAKLSGKSPHPSKLHDHGIQITIGEARKEASQIAELLKKII